MGHPIVTGVDIGGHQVHFDRGDEPEPSCTMVCSRGWQVELTAWDKSYGVIETKTRFNRHLRDLGLDGEGITPALGQIHG